MAGSIAWPPLSQTGRYAESRSHLAKLFAKRAEQGAFSYDDRRQIGVTRKALLEELKGQVREAPQTDYVAAKQLKKNLAYEPRIPAS